MFFCRIILRNAKIMLSADPKAIIFVTIIPPFQESMPVFIGTEAHGRLLTKTALTEPA